MCASTALTMLISKLDMLPVMNWASEELKQRYLPPVASWERQASYCLSEADAGSDVALMRTRAVRDGDHYVLTGSKHWITNAGISDTYTVFAVTDPEAPRAGGSVASWWRLIGGSRWLATRTRWVCGVAPRQPSPSTRCESLRPTWWGEGMGFTIAIHTLDRSRPTIGAQGVGIAQGAVDYAAGYMRERMAFGKPIADQQGLRLMLAEMAMRTEAARTLVYRVCSVIDAGDPEGELTTVGVMAKGFASDTAMAGPPTRCSSSVGMAW